MTRRTDPRRRSTVRLRWKIASAILAPVLFLGLAEGVLWVANVDPPAFQGPPVHFLGVNFETKFPVRWHSELFWELVPDGVLPRGFTGRPPALVDERISRHGFRGGPDVERKASGTRRVLCVGDSNVFGSHVAMESTFAYRLGRWLNDQEQKWDVINAGVPGYSAYQIARFIETRGRSLEPDLVVVYAGAWNDFTPAMGADDESIAADLGAASDGFMRLRSLRLLKSWLPQPESDSSAAERKRQYVRNFAKTQSRPEGPRVPQATFRRILGDIRRDVTAMGARVLFIVPPAPADTRNKFVDADRYAAIVKEVGGRDAVDIRAEFISLEANDAELYHDWIHPSARGHAEIFERITGALIRNGVPGTPRSPGDASAPLLTTLALTADCEVGEPPKKMPLSRALQMVDDLPTVPCPSTVYLRGVKVPPMASLVAAPSFRPAARPLRFEIWVDGASGEPPQLLSKHTARGRRPWSNPFRLTADLSRFAGDVVTVRLVVAGPQTRASWGLPQVHPYR